MESRHGRDGPGTIGRGRGDSETVTSTPDRAPTGATSASSYATRTTLAEQVAVSDAVDVGRDLDTAEMLVWDSGWQTERCFRVRTTIGAAPDGGLRQKWAKGLLFDCEDRFEGEDPGLCGVREPLPDPGGSGSGSAVLQLVAD